MISVVWLCQLFNVVGRLVNFFGGQYQGLLFHSPSKSHFDLVERKKESLSWFFFIEAIIWFFMSATHHNVLTFLIWPSNFYIINFTVEKCLSIFCLVEKWKLKDSFTLCWKSRRVKLFYVCVIVSKDTKASRKVHAFWFKSKYQFSLSTSCNLKSSRFYYNAAWRTSLALYFSRLRLALSRKI